MRTSMFVGGLAQKLKIPSFYTFSQNINWQGPKMINKTLQLHFLRNLKKGWICLRNFPLNLQV